MGMGGGLPEGYLWAYLTGKKENASGFKAAGILAIKGGCPLLLRRCRGLRAAMTTRLVSRHLAP